MALAMTQADCGTQRQGSETGTIDVRSLHDSLTANPDLFVVDVRTQPEWEAERIVGIKQYIPYDQIPARHAELGVPADTPIYLICRVGNRSGVAAEMLADLGYKNTFNVVGGTVAWAEAGLPTESGPVAPTSAPTDSDHNDSR